MGLTDLPHCKRLHLCVSVSVQMGVQSSSLAASGRTGEGFFSWGECSLILVKTWRPLLSLWAGKRCMMGPLHIELL